MKKLSFILLAVVLFTTSLIGQNLRDMTAVVRPVYDESTIKFFNDFSKSLKRDGYYYAAELLKSYSEGGFGTGFTYKDTASGKYYIITNRHVVAQAEYVDIEFMPGGKSTKKYNKCRVAAVHDNFDLALVALPDDFNDAALPLYNKELEDGLEIFSAGFPGLGTEPSWQLGKGIISNSAVYIEDLTNDDTTPIIQHTAQVDAGSSGGPLLARNENAPGGYEVVGINTWKAQGRENVNFALPYSIIKDFVNEYLHNENILTEADLKQRAKDLIQAAQTDYKKVLPYISYDYISKLTVNSFYELLNASSEKAQKEIAGCFKSGAPIEGVRIALADAVCKNIVSQSTEFAGIENFSPGSKTAAVTFKQGSKQISSSWNAEQGRWRLSNISSLSLRNLDDKGISTKYGYGNSLRLGIGVPMGGEQFDMIYNMTFGRTIRTFVTYDINLSLSRINRMESNFNETTLRDDSVMVKRNLLGFDLGLGGQLPIKISSIYLIPYIKGWAGMGIGYEMGTFNYGFSAGVEAAYKLNYRTYLIAGAGFRKKLYSSFDEDFHLNPAYTLEAHIGITF